MEPKMKIDSSSFQYCINVHKYNLEYGRNENLIPSRDTLKPIPHMFHDYLLCNLLNQPTSTSHDVQPVVLSGNQEQGSCISHVEEKHVQDMYYISSLFQDDNISFLANLWSYNHDNMSNKAKPHIQVETLHNLHHDIHVSINTFCGEYTSTLDDIWYYLEDMDLQSIDLESVSHSLESPFVKHDVISISNDPICPLIHTYLDAKSEVVSW